MKIFDAIKELGNLLKPTKPKGFSDLYSKVIASTVMFSPRLKSFYKVDTIATGARIVHRMYGEGTPGDFVMMLKHNEPLFVCDYVADFTEEELKMMLLLYKF